MKAKFYGRSVIEQPKFSIIEMQKILNEYRSLSALADELAEALKEEHIKEHHYVPKERCLVLKLLEKYRAFKKGEK